jgi:hypothetical protein
MKSTAGQEVIGAIVGVASGDQGSGPTQSLSQTHSGSLLKWIFRSESVGDGQSVDPDLLVVHEIEIDRWDEPEALAEVDVVADADPEQEVGDVLISFTGLA